MKYLKGRPQIDECKDYVDISYRPKGEENWNTRHLSVWMDRFTFIAELARWQVDNYELSDEEIFSAILAWNITHVEQEAMLEMNVMMLEVEKDFYRKQKSNKKDCSDTSNIGEQNEVH